MAFFGNCRATSQKFIDLQASNLYYVAATGQLDIHKMICKDFTMILLVSFKGHFIKEYRLFKKMILTFWITPLHVEWYDFVGQCKPTLMNCRKHATCAVVKP